MANQENQSFETALKNFFNDRNLQNKEEQIKYINTFEGMLDFDIDFEKELDTEKSDEFLKSYISYRDSNIKDFKLYKEILFPDTLCSIVRENKSLIPVHFNLKNFIISFIENFEKKLSEEQDVKKQPIIRLDNKTYRNKENSI